MGKPCCLLHNHLIIVIYLEVFWVGSETHFSPCHVVWGKPQRGGDSYGPGCFMENGMEMYRRVKLVAHGRRSRKTEPRAWCWSGSRDGVGRWRQGLVSVGSLEGRGRAVLCPFPSVPDLGCMSSNASSKSGLGCSWSSSRDGSGGGQRFREGCEDAALQHGQEPPPAQGTYVAMLCTRSRESKRRLDQRLIL